MTTARSDYGPSTWLLREMLGDARFDVSLLVGGAHLSDDHGRTVQEIERDGLPIAARIDFLGNGDKDSAACAAAAARALGAYAAAFQELRPDVVVLYGDRFELLAIAMAALYTNLPIAHLCGGDLTEGAMDNQVRYALTKLAHLHFPSTPRSALRVLQTGEEAWRVHQVGDPALDSFLYGERASSEELAAMLGFAPDRRTLLVTFHPVTLELAKLPDQLGEVMATLQAYDGPVILTAPAPDPGGAQIRGACERLAGQRHGTVFVPSLGARFYRALLYRVGAMVGNSSSGLIEAASVPLPVVNVGNRQRGRERAANVIDAAPDRVVLGEAIAQALSADFQRSLADLTNPYGDGRASERICDVLGAMPPGDRLLTKRFVDWTPASR